MKNLFILFSFLLIENGHAQAIGDMFSFKVITNVTAAERMNIHETTRTAAITRATVPVHTTVIFVVRSVESNVVKFYALPFPSPSSGSEVGTSRDRAFRYNDIEFEISTTDYQRYTKPFEFVDRVSFGVLALPYKLRPQRNTSFESEFNLNSTLGFLLPHKRFGSLRTYLQLGAGVGSVSLNPSNAPGLNADQAQSVSCFSGFTGLMMQYKDVQAGVYVGGDWIKNNKKYNWESQGNLWLSLGVGFKIFTISKKTPSN